MTENILYLALLLITGIAISGLVILILSRLSNKVSKYLELYPESRGILSFSLHVITWLIGTIIFLVFLRWVLELLNQQFVLALVESAILFAPKCILGLLIILGGYYTSRLVRVRIQKYQFSYKERILLLVDFIIYMTFVFTALYTIGVNVLFFLHFYLIILITIGILAALILSMVIGIPLGLSIYEKTHKSRNKRK